MSSSGGEQRGLRPAAGRPRRTELKVKRFSRKAKKLDKGDQGIFLINESRLKMKLQIIISHPIRMQLVICGFQVRRHRFCVYPSFILWFVNYFGP